MLVENILGSIPKVDPLQRKETIRGFLRFPSDLEARWHKETLKGMRVCFERRADYVILIVYSHLNFNLPFSLFFAARKLFSSFSFYLS